MLNHTCYKHKDGGGQGSRPVGHGELSIMPRNCRAVCVGLYHDNKVLKVHAILANSQSAHLRRDPRKSNQVGR